MNPDLYQELVRQINSLQKQVDGLVKPEVGRWVDWIPTVTQLGAVARNINYARYCVIDNVVHVVFKATVTGAGTAGNIITVAGLPFSNANQSGDGQDIIGKFGCLDTSAGTRHTGVIYAVGPTSLGFLVPTLSFLGVNPNFGLANGDVLGGGVIYERT